jgi:hypothetical protein
VKIIDSKINIGPVAEIIFNGCPENKEKAAPQTAPAKIHSIVAYFNKYRRQKERIITTIELK